MRAHGSSAHKLRHIAAFAVWVSALTGASGLSISQAMAACSGSGAATWTVSCSGTDTDGYSASKAVNSKVTIVVDAVVNNSLGGAAGVSMTSSLGSVTITNLGQINQAAGPGVSAIGANGVTINGAGGSITTASNKGPGIFGLSAVGNVTITDTGSVSSGTGNINSSTVSALLSGLSLPSVLSGGIVASAVAANVRIGGSDGITGTITTAGNFGILATAADEVKVNTKLGSVVTAASGSAITALAGVGNMSINNSGSLTGSGSNVTTAAVWGSSVTGNLSVTNSGSITTTRSIPAAGYAVTLVGLDLVTPGAISLTNNLGGSITGRLSLGSGDPSYSAASTTLTNAGTWTTSGASQFGANGVVTLSNSGTISTSGTTTFSMSSSSSAAVTNTGSFSTSGSLHFTGSPGFTNSATGAVSISGGTLDGFARFSNTSTATIAGTTADAVVVASDAGITASTSIISSAGAFKNLGVLTAPTITISGGALTTTGTITGDLVNTATVNADGGSISGSVANNAGGVVNIGGAVSSGNGFANATATSTLNVKAGGAYTITGALTNSGAVTVSSGGTLTLSGGGSRIVNNAGATITVVQGGAVIDDLNNSGTVTVAGSYIADVTNSGLVTVDATGSWTGKLLGNAVGVADSTLGVVNKGTWTGDAVNDVGGRIDNQGTWTGDIANSGTLTNASTGTLNAAVVTNNRAGTLTSEGTLNATALLSNQGIMNVAGTFNAPVVDNTGTFNTTGALSAAIGTFNNTGTGIFDISSGDFTGVTTFNNAATLGSAGVRSLGAGTFNNQGTGVVTMRNLVSTDHLTLRGTYVGSQGSVIALDVRMASAAPTGDTLTITGAGSSGSTIVALKTLDVTKGFFTTPLKLIEGSGTASFAAAADADTLATLAPGKMVGYSFQQISDGVWGLVSTLDLRAAGGPAAHTKSALTSLNTSFFQNVSSLLTAPAGAAADAFFGGLWIRPAGGANQISHSSTSTSGAPTRTTVGVNFAGFQVGADFGVANVSGSGLDLHLGVSAGQVDLSGSDRKVQSGTSSTFSSPYFTTYLALQGNGFFADAQARRLNFDGAISNAGGGFKVPIKSHGDTISLNAGYRLSGGALYLEPSIGFSRTRHQGANVTVEDVGELRLANIRSDLGKVGVRVGAPLLFNYELQVDPYVGVNFWREIDRAAQSHFKALSGAMADVKTHPIQSFTQVSLGVDAKLTRAPVVAFLRADGRFGIDMRGWSVTGGIRASF